MSDTYTKLFSGITASTIVSQPLSTRWLWVTMLAMADASGKVYASVPGLARYANISLEDTEQGLQALLSPDPYSRTKEHEGRRIAEIDGGWLLLNHAKYKGIRGESERREYKREWDRNNRKKAENPTKSDNCGQNPTVPTHPTPPTPTPTLKDKEKNTKKKSASALVATRPDDVSESVWASWLALRARNKATACETALEQARREAAKAGVDLEEFLRLWVGSGYRGFKANWIKPEPARTSTAAITPSPVGSYEQKSRAHESW